MPSPEAILRGLFDAAVAAVAPARVVPPHLPPPPKGRTIVLGAGKAAAAMARAVEESWAGALEGFVVTATGHGVPCTRIAVVEAAHPMPDADGMAAARRALDLVLGLGPDDLVLALISGGGSALLPLPAPGLTLADKRAVTAALLRSGATIAEINTVRKHLSAIKGGRLAAAAAPARVVTLVISDVPGDHPATVASGPTLPDPSTFAEARAVLDKYRVDVPDAVRRHLAAAADETPKRLDNAEAVVIARAADALAAAAAHARTLGIEPTGLGDALEGEALALGMAHAKLAREGRGPCVLLSGGETGVTIAKGAAGRGGRNTEYLLGLGLALAGAKGIFALAADTDGIDGEAGAAGAILRPGSLVAARTLGLDPREIAAGHDSARLFATLGDLVVTGPTRTNVNDFRAILIVR
jgi:hydroxypyruvate reductase